MNTPLPFTKDFDIPNFPYSNWENFVKSYSLDQIKRLGKKRIKSEFMSRYSLLKIIVEKEEILEYKSKNTLASVYDVSHPSDREYEGSIYLYQFNFSIGANLLYYKPKEYSVYNPQYENHYSYTEKKPYIIFKIYIPELDVPKFEAEKKKIKNFIDKNIHSLNNDFEKHNSRIDDLFENAFDLHFSELEKEYEFNKLIGIKIEKETDSLITPVPIHIDKAPEKPQPAEKRPSKAQPLSILSNETYEDIIRVINKFYNLVAQRPSMYKEKDEPDLRDLILPLLQIRYHKTNVTAETFISQGKTDLLIQDHDHKNIFVAEYKKWKGPKELLSAIEQLFMYITVREIKTALVVFDESKGFARMQETAKQTMSKHPNFKYVEEDKGYPKYVFTHPHDEGSIIHITLLCFHLKKIE